ncbi:uncharacterized protein IL334_007316 [Kwoniella shivajii]|uniref:GPI-anchored wall transfer protein 1 n=1 Tax=Kwoniella shivajii TaxID=564305 RepID=A0ABZ1D946_9TREE|nr:hypothetical protein IL334_007316 [Kwoniella shivajii]
MADYKSAKEAFVSDNPGSSIFTIISISSVAWTSYALYATLYPRVRRRPSFLFDYFTSSLPLVLGITIFSNSPISFNITLVSLALFVYLTTPITRRIKHVSLIKKDKSKGSWLEESDSDEEIAEPTYTSSTSTSTINPKTSNQSTPIKITSLPSQIPLTSTSSSSSTSVYSHSNSLSRSGSTSNPNSIASSPISPSSSGSAVNSPLKLSVDDPFKTIKTTSGPSKRRLSPQPSPDNVTVNILPTPPFNETDQLVSPISNYPSPIRRNPPTPLWTGNERSIENGEEGGKRKLPFLSVYRAHMMIMTIHCILAVDFKVFPRWLGKCENFGTSLMDVGVGSFVFSLGLISFKSLSSSFTQYQQQRQRQHHNHSRSDSNGLTPTSPSIPLIKKTDNNISVEILKALKKSTPTLILGFIRLLMVKGVEYPEHVTEYGVHWNFFFTIGLLPVFGVIISPLRKWVRWSVLAISLSLVHQIILSYCGLESFLLSASRPGLLGLNKEGISSLPGYISIYLLGLATGEHISRLSSPLPPREITGGVTESPEDHIKRHYEKRRTELILELFGYTIAWWTALGIGLYFNLGQVSRRFANTPYVLFIASYNTLFLLGYLLLESAFPQIPTPLLLESINKNGLIVFLIANLGTGLVNVSMETMYVNTYLSMSVLILYSIGVCGIAWIPRGKRIGI